MSSPSPADSGPVADTPWLTPSRLQRPGVRADALARPRLLDAVSRAVDGARLLLITAPPGSGKTMLLASWLQQAERAAWLTLAPEDDDPARFLAALAAAAAQLTARSGSAAARLASQGRAARRDAGELGQQVVSALVNDLLDAGVGRAALVLDDLHAVSDPAIYAALDYLVERLPAGVALVAATRSDPPLSLARLRARRELVELRLPSLRFTPEETAALLNDQLGLAIAPRRVAALHRNTEGWPAGIGLLAASLERIRTPAERDAFLANLAPTNHHAFAYLAAEVLGRQDPFVRMFLLETAILDDLTPAACRAITGRPDAEAILDDLYRRNLFLIRLDDARPAATATYRYHDLFRSFLRDQLMSEAAEWHRELHRRAARAEDAPARRLHHLLQAALYDEAADLAERAGAQLAAAAAFASSLPEEVRAAHPRLARLLDQAAARWDDGPEKPQAPARPPAAGAGGPSSGAVTLPEPLTRRELEVLRLLADGASNAAIARQLTISPNTAARHTSAIFQKLGVTSRAAAAARARELNLLSIAQ